MTQEEPKHEPPLAHFSTFAVLCAAVSLRNRSAPRSYSVQRRIAAGGMGEVYEAFAPDLNRPVAIKRMLEANAGDHDLRLLFFREVAVAATLEHHNVVQVLDAGPSGNEFFLVMEYVDGPALAEVMEVLQRENKILPIEVSCYIVSCVAQALTHAHERALPDGTPLGIVHRDIAPENVLIGTNGIPKLVDFGLATLAGHSLTQPGIIRGRPRCLSPEQARGDNVDVRSDLFSLGALLFELVAGQPLYPNEAMATLLWKVAAGDYGDLDSRLTHVDPDLVEIMRTAVAVNPEARFRSAREMERALDGFRAARGMRVSSRALAQVVSLTRPKIEASRIERLDGSVGEMEGVQLVLEPDNLETIGDTSGEFFVDPRPPPPRPQRPTPASGIPESGIFTEKTPAVPLLDLPKPTAPRQQGQKFRLDSELIWVVYLAGLLLVAAVVFAGVYQNASQLMAAVAD